MKSYTDIEQSKKLADILPLESADCYWDYDEMQKFHRISWFENGYNKESQLILNENNVCAWSLAALLRELPETILGKDKDGYVVMVETKGSGLTTFADEPIDACYEMIIKLYEQKIL